MIDYGYGVALGPLQEENLMVYAGERNDERIRKWCRQIGVLSDLDQDDWYERQHNDPSIRMFEVVLEDTTIGVCGFTDISHVHQRAEFSCYIFAEDQGRGYGEAALRTLFQFGFLDLNLNRIWGETFDGNPALNMFTKKLGMEIEGTRREFYYGGGRFIDCYLVSLARRDFRPRFSIVEDSDAS